MRESDTSPRKPSHPADYLWERHWSPASAHKQREGSRGWFYYHYPFGEEPLLTKDLTSKSQFLVLIGGLGTGKTSELKQIAKLSDSPDQQKISKLVQASALGPSPNLTIEALPEWQIHKRGNAHLTLIIDSIDEALSYIPHLQESLSLFIENNFSPNFTIVLGMRTGAWHAGTYRRAFESWQTTEDQAVYEIQPLRTADVELVFRNSELGDASEFLSWVQAMDAAPLARIPLYLDDVIQNWKNTPKRRLSIHELRNLQISRLLSDKPNKPSHLSPKVSLPKLEALAEMIAIHVILSGRPRLVWDLQESDNLDCVDLRIFELPPLSAVWKLGNETFMFTRELLDILLSRPLFRQVSSINPQQGFFFEHHSFAEHLAGRALLRQPLSRLLKMLGNSNGSRIVPQMEPLASLLATSNPSLCDWLLLNQPKSLLTSNAAEFDDLQKGRVISQVLSSLEASDENERLSWTQIDTGYSCSNVGQVLGSIIENKSLKKLTRIGAIDITKVCPTEEASKSLWNTFNDIKEDDWIRDAAAEAWIACTQLDTSAHIQNLWKIARGELGLGKSNTKVSSLQSIFKNGAAVKDIVKHLPKRERNSNASLDRFKNYHLPKFLTIPDVPDCLIFLSTDSNDAYHTSHKESLLYSTLQLSLANLDNQAIRKSFSDYWWISLSKYYEPLPEHFIPSLNSLSDDKRRSLTLSLIESKKRPPKDFEWKLPLGPKDFQWASENYFNSTDTNRPIWRKIVSLMWIESTKEMIPTWLEPLYLSGDMEFRAIFPKPTRGRSLNETIARFHRAVVRHGERRQLRSLRKRKNATRSPRWTRVEFNEFVEGEFATSPTTGWIRFTYLAFELLSDDPPKDSEHAQRIDQSTGWSSLSNRGKELGRKAARIFLENESATYTLGYWSPRLIAAQHGIKLLEDEVRKDPNLQQIIADKWLLAVVHHLELSTDDQLDFVAFLKSISAVRLRSAWIAEVEYELGNCNSCSLAKYERSWDKNDSDHLSYLLLKKLFGIDRQRQLRRLEHLPKLISKRRLAKERECTEGFLKAFLFLADVDTASAIEFVRLLFQTPIHLRPRAHSAFPILIVAGVLRFPETLDERSWNAIYRFGSSTLRQTFKSLLDQLEYFSFFRGNYLSKLTSDNLTTLYRLFDYLFPDPPTRTFEDDDEETILSSYQADFEEHIKNTLVQQGAEPQIIQLIQGLRSHHRKENLRWHLGGARRKADEASWLPASVSSISRWLQMDDAILVRNEEDLVGAILTSLSRYQDRLRRDGRMLLDCWERQQGKSKFQPSHEEDLSTRITFHLNEDLKQLIVSREAEIRVNAKRNKTDIIISITIHNRPTHIIIEHKRAHNPEVKHAITTQLIDRYLMSSGIHSGIYLVSWFDGYTNSAEPVRNRLGVDTLEEAQRELSRQALLATETRAKSISTFVLDCVPPH